jgi:hypothetical protein
MRVAFYVPNIGVKNIDFSRPENGNPGTGAAEYLHVALPYYISSGKIKTFIYAQSTEGMPRNVDCVQCDSIRDAAIKAKKNSIDFFIFRPRINEEENILDLIDELQLPSIGRSALTPSPGHQRKMAKTQYFRCLVAVGSEQYDYMCDSPISQKLTYIDNGISISACEKYDKVNKNKNLITYMGAIVPQKGFHVLAKVWPEIIARNPDAELRVIGSSRIYNEKYPVGPLGVAEINYEKNQIMPYLCGRDGKLIPSVKFLGNLGEEKYRHLSESLISVPNPTGQTETCCVSAIEMQACGSAVVTGAYYALLGTIQHKETGLLGRGERALVNNICYLLDNPDSALRYGAKGREVAKARYDFKVVCSKWSALLCALQNGELIRPRHNFDYLIFHRKWVRIINRFAATTIGKMVYWPSIQEVELSIIHLWRAIKSKATRSR